MSLLERKLSKDELAKREDIIMNMKKNKRDLVKKIRQICRSRNVWKSN